MEIVERNPQERGFVPQPKRWRVEQTYGILLLHRATGPRLRAPPGLFRVPRVLGDDPCHGPPTHRREHSHLARGADGDRVNLQHLLDALGIQEDAARAPD
ncbi:hypothetical protein GCM10010244_80650 [Streptomyces coeruleorubidus]|nr:hypothetical protein GCM10010244_80650 [Streptomyces bellus]